MTYHKYKQIFQGGPEVQLQGSHSQFQKHWIKSPTRYQCHQPFLEIFPVLRVYAKKILRC